jgi:hypothetical protein
MFMSLPVKDESRQPSDEEEGFRVIEIDAVTLANMLQQQTALPITPDEADGLARAIEASATDEELLANTLAAVRLIVARLDPTAHR